MGDSIWQDKEVRFDSPFSQLKLRPGEKLIDRLDAIEDNKGNAGERGRLVVTNLRVMWHSLTSPRINLCKDYRLGKPKHWVERNHSRRNIISHKIETLYSITMRLGNVVCWKLCCQHLQIKPVNQSDRWITSERSIFTRERIMIFACLLIIAGRVNSFGPTVLIGVFMSRYWKYCRRQRLRKVDMTCLLNKEIQTGEL